MQGKNLKNKRALPLSLKSTQAQKKRNCDGNKTPSLTGFLEIKRKIETVDTCSCGLNGKDRLEFCPACQAPFAGLVGQSPHSHVLKCLENLVESPVTCPDGVDCNSIDPQHFQSFSHHQLAKSRSMGINTDYSPNDKKLEGGGQPKECLECNMKNCTCTVLPGSVDDGCVGNTCSSMDDGSSSVNSGFGYNDNSFVQSAKVTDNSRPRQEVLMSENDVDETHCKNGTMETTSLIPEQEKKGCDSFVDDMADDMKEDMNNWFNDNFTYEQFELDNYAEFTGDTKGSATNSSANDCTPNSHDRNMSTSQDTDVSPNSQSDVNDMGKRQLSISLFTEVKKPPPKVKKQMDIGVFFGLKPKQNMDVIELSNSESAGVLEKNKVLSQEKRDKGRVQIRKCPFYKIVDGTTFAVDAFSYGNIAGVSVYFLTHFHYDHYGGLQKSFSKPIYCSQITANLISLKIKVASCYIHPLPLHQPVRIENVEVTLLEANHCPGAVMFLFKLPNGKTHLHTGDFRASSSMETNPFLCHSHVHTLYPDTTYCDPDYSFPAQSETVDYCVSLVTEAVKKNARTLIVVGTYTIGKEKIFIAVAEALKCKVGVRRDKHNVLQCLESPHLQQIITQCYKEAQVHVIPMGDLTHKRLALHLKEYSSDYDEVLAIKPTGWTFTHPYNGNLTQIKPSRRGAVTIYGVPYSEHSSYKELQ